MDDERIVAAAIFCGGTISLPPPARHGTILHSMQLVMGFDLANITPPNQGFLTSKGRFVNRREGYDIALKQGQIIHKSGNADVPELFSEDMW